MREGEYEFSASNSRAIGGSGESLESCTRVSLPRPKILRWHYMEDSAVVG